MANKKKDPHVENQDLPTLFSRPGHLVRRLHQICSSIFIDHARDFNLTAVQLATLQTVANRPGIDQATLGKIVALDRQNASNLVARMCARGLLERKNKNRRAHSLYITRAGAFMVQQMMRRAAGIDEKILEPLSISERKTLLTLLKKLTTENNELSRAPVSEQHLENATGKVPARPKTKRSRRAGLGERK